MLRVNSNNYVFMYNICIYKHHPFPNLEYDFY